PAGTLGVGPRRVCHRRERQRRRRGRSVRRPTRLRCLGHPTWFRIDDVGTGPLGPTARPAPLGRPTRRARLRRVPRPRPTPRSQRSPPDHPLARAAALDLTSRQIWPDCGTVIAVTTKTPVPAIDGWFTLDADEPALLGTKC